MMKTVMAVVIPAVILLLSTALQAEEVSCKGDITSIQGEGLVARTHRFEVEVTGSDVMAVLEKCKRIAQEKQNRAGGRNPGGPFRKFSDVNLQCTQGDQNFPVRRTLFTAR